MTDTERGRLALRVFYSFWKTYPEASKFTYEDLEKMLTSRRPMGGAAFLDGLGGGIREAGMSDSRVTEAMRSLAQNSRGKLPATNMDFFTYLTNQATKINYIDAAVYTFAETAKDVGRGVVSVGESILTVGKIMNFFLPAIAIFFIVIWLNKKSDGNLFLFAGKAAGAFKK